MNTQQEVQEKYFPMPENANINILVYLAAENNKILTTSTFPVSLIDIVLATVSKCFNVSINDLRGFSRNKTIHRPRMIAIWVIRKKTAANLVNIAKKLGGRDHTTIIAALNTAKDLFETREEVFMSCWEKYKAFAPSYLVPPIPDKLNRLK